MAKKRRVLTPEQKLTKLVNIQQKLIRAVEGTARHLADLESKLKLIHGWQEDADLHLETKLRKLDKTVRALDKLAQKLERRSVVKAKRRRP